MRKYKTKEQIENEYKTKLLQCPYKMTPYREFDYSILQNIRNFKKQGKRDDSTYNDCFIMADTETSKKTQQVEFYNVEYDDILNYIVHTPVLYKKEFSEIATYNELRRTGFNFKKEKYIHIDTLYEELRGIYPYIFKNECFNELDCLGELCDYLENNKYEPEVNKQNHVCAFTLSIRAYHTNIVTLYGHKPSELVDCIDMVMNAMNGNKTLIYFHNLPYDYTFLRKFLFNKFGFPENQLNTKPHYPISIEFDNGLILRDSLILAQRSLDSWGKTLDVEHKKAKGKWDYDLIRNQNVEFTADELEYIEFDTLCGVECLDKLAETINKRSYNLPFTATGIPREMVRKLAYQNNGHDRFLRQALTYEQYKKCLKVYHGGYTHANRGFIGYTMGTEEEPVEAYDESSAYPFAILTGDYPCEKFTPIGNCSVENIIADSDQNAYIFKLIAIDVELKKEVAMPILQTSKCVKLINSINDNGRILKADYLEIYLNEIDLRLIAKQYNFGKHICTEVEFATKRKLPRWFTDYVFELYKDKTYLKGGIPSEYAIKKSTLNSLYGLCCQKSVRESILEDFVSGEYYEEVVNEEELYEKYLNSKSSVLPFQWSCWVTSIAMENLFSIAECCGLHLYSDTDSCYGLRWDKDKLNKYNETCKQKLINNGYGCVEFNNREYWLGIAEFDGSYSEYRTLGAKRYCGRSTKDGELHITIAGVPKSGVCELNNDIHNFKKGMVFRGTKTGKKTHTYIYVDEIYIDNEGNETGDSIDLTPCDYLLDEIQTYNWEDVVTKQIIQQVY